jgi:hypothetical protein
MNPDNVNDAERKRGIAAHPVSLLLKRYNLSGKDRALPHPGWEEPLIHRDNP